MDIHGKALQGMFDDMDDMESKKMFGEPQDANGGVDITISVSPKGGKSKESEDPAMMNKGGVACYDEGGMVPEVADDDFKLPPFMRKKKKV